MDLGPEPHGSRGHGRRGRARVGPPPRAGRRAPGSCWPARDGRGVQAAGRQLGRPRRRVRPLPRRPGGPEPAGGRGSGAFGRWTAPSSASAGPARRRAVAGRRAVARAFDSVFLGRCGSAGRSCGPCRPEGGSIALVLSSSVKGPVAGLAASNGLRPGLAHAGQDDGRRAGTAGRARSTGCSPARCLTDRLRELGATDDDVPGEIPLRRYGDPAEFGRIAAFVLSPAASYLSGAMVPVDGGLSGRLSASAAAGWCPVRPRRPGHLGPHAACPRSPGPCPSCPSRRRVVLAHRRLRRHRSGERAALRPAGDTVLGVPATPGARGAGRQRPRHRGGGLRPRRRRPAGRPRRAGARPARPHRPARQRRRRRGHRPAARAVRGRRRAGLPDQRRRVRRPDPARPAADAPARQRSRRDAQLRRRLGVRPAVDHLLLQQVRGRRPGGGAAARDRRHRRPGALHQPRTGGHRLPGPHRRAVAAAGRPGDPAGPGRPGGLGGGRCGRRGSRLHARPPARCRVRSAWSGWPSCRRWASCSTSVVGRLAGPIVSTARRMVDDRVRVLTGR
jgi:3-oxoacyl-[acyl-carrier protein] reductase